MELFDGIIWWNYVMELFDEITWWNHFIISKCWNAMRNKCYDLASFFHSVTFAEKQEVDDVIQQELFLRKWVTALLLFWCHVIVAWFFDQSASIWCIIHKINSEEVKDTQILTKLMFVTFWQFSSVMHLFVIL